jgi:hypothetical protein
MSTRKIREALDRLSEEHEEGVVREAIKEVEAIEKACLRVAGGYLKVSPFDDEDDAHRDLLDAIGEEVASREEDK